MIKFIKLLSILFNIRLYFLKPKKSKVLIYDKTSILFANTLFKSNYVTYDVRYESINLNILFKTIVSKGFFNLKTEYKKLFFNTVEPKIVYTSIDNNLGFYKLKSIYPNAIYISDQNGIRNDVFYKKCLKHNKINKTKLQCDYFFTFGSDEKKRLSKIINAKIIIGGNTLNNFFPIKRNSKKKSMIFISSGLKQNFFDTDVDMFNHLIKFSKLNKFKLFFLSRPNVKMKPMLKKKTTNNNWKFVTSNRDRGKTYNTISKYGIVVFAHSTLGYEAMARGLRTVSLNHLFYNTQEKKDPIEGPFWSEYKNYNDIENIIFKTFNYSNRKWKSIYLKYSKKILFFDFKNKKKITLINKILK